MNTQGPNEVAQLYFNLYIHVIGGYLTDIHIISNPKRSINIDHVVFINFFCIHVNR